MGRTYKNILNFKSAKTLLDYFYRFILRLMSIKMPEAPM